MRSPCSRASSRCRSCPVWRRRPPRSASWCSAVVKLFALLVAATSGFRGGRIFPTLFIGVTLGFAIHQAWPSVSLPLAVGCACVGILVAATRSGWLSIFMAVAVVPQMVLLPGVHPGDARRVAAGDQPAAADRPEGSGAGGSTRLITRPGGSSEICPRGVLNKRVGLSMRPYEPVPAHVAPPSVLGVLVGGSARARPRDAGRRGQLVVHRDHGRVDRPERGRLGLLRLPHGRPPRVRRRRPASVDRRDGSVARRSPPATWPPTSRSPTRVP